MCLLLPFAFIMYGSESNTFYCKSDFLQYFIAFVAFFSPVIILLLVVRFGTMAGTRRGMDNLSRRGRKNVAFFHVVGAKKIKRSEAVGTSVITDLVNYINNIGSFH